MKAKKITMTMLLMATMMPMCEIVAQEQEDHVVIRRRYTVTEKEEKPANTSPWFNNFTLGWQLGYNTVADSKGYVAPTAYYSGKSENFYYSPIDLSEDRENYIQAALVVGYQRLYKKNNYYLGPGLNLCIGSYFRVDAYAHGEIEAGGLGEFMGFNLNKLHPYAGASLGLSFMTNYEIEKIKYRVRYDNNYYGAVSTISDSHGGRDHFNSYDDINLSGIRGYFDLEGGFAIPIGSHSYLNIAYHATLMPMYHYRYDPSEHLSELQALLDSDSYNGDHYFEMDESHGISLHHGLRVSLKF